MKSHIQLIFLRLRKAINPLWIAESSLKKAISNAVTRAVVISPGLWVDLGCGKRPYEFLFEGQKYLGLDVLSSGRPLNMKHPDIFFDGSSIPIKCCSVDGVLCTQVLEHVPDPVHLLKQVSVMLRPEGRVIFSIPLMWEEHEAPYDFFRYTQFGIRRIFSEAGLFVEEIYPTTGAIEAFAQMLSVYAIQNLAPPFKGGGWLVGFFFCMPIQLLAKTFQRILPDRGGIYLDNIVVARKSPTVS
jgi:SAM-dependent methyltransferase